MTPTEPFSAADLAEFGARGLSVDEVQRQLHLFEQPPAPIQLDRPCSVGDGIRVLSAAEIDAATAAQQQAAHDGRLMKFVPASGAATRMFQALLAPDGRHTEPIRAFLAGIERFAFYDDLHAVLAARGLDLQDTVRRGEISEILDAVLGPQGLDYAALPKGLLKFHRYPDDSRTPFEEHLAEAASTVADAQRTCRVQFTVSPEHEPRFRARLCAIRGSTERRHDVRFEVGFSTQKPSTDTVAVDLENRPFRTADGQLLFRPGGHGALIENLYELGGDIIYVKNIDNVVPDWRRADTVTWKKALAGLLVTLQRTIFDHLARLQGRPDGVVIDAALGFARNDLCLSVPQRFDPKRAEEQRRALIRLLDRPLRVCGVVRNTGEPGGGPFWVRDRDGSLSLQIVESAQVAPDSPQQQALFQRATYFNPVDLVCGVRNYRGDRFDLRRFVDPDAVFIASKSKDGRTLKALERPGLWNGAMAHWVTVFVEVPGTTFTPVKTVLDLLRPEHQPQ
jgi:hypothetical protein